MNGSPASAADRLSFATMNRMLYLASQSPRRMALLRQIGVTPILLPLRNAPPRGEVDETPLPGEEAGDYVRRLALMKARAGLKAMLGRRLTPRPILAADTTVTLDGVLLGKPADAAEAGTMLRAYSGRTHQVLTGVCLAHGERLEVRVSTSEVRFKTLDAAEIEAYLATGEAWGKAGAYGIQGHAAIFIEYLAGSYSGVMGLPLFETAELLRAAGVDLY
jgi:septum formation protein